MLYKRPPALFSYLSLFMISHISLCSQVYQIIPLSTSQTLTLFSTTPLIFQIPANTSLGTGKFDVSVSATNIQYSYSFLMNRQKCGILDSIGLPYNQFYSSHGLSGISFYANASDDQCFKVELFTNVHSPISGNFTIQITFSPIDWSIHIGKALSFDFPKNSEKRFSCYLDNPSLDIILITIKQTSSFTDLYQNIDLELRQNIGVCIQPQIKIPGQKAWLCHLVDTRETVMFSVFNKGYSGRYEVITTQIKPQEIGPEIERVISSSIPGFGNLFAVNLYQVGVLKIKAISLNEKMTPIIAANSILNLFGALAQDINKISLSKNGPSNETPLLIQNKNMNMCWYYFVPETKSGSYLLRSNFIKQMTLNINTESIYYINPEIYEFQQVKVNIGPRDYLEKYEAVLYAEQPNSPMNLYYDAEFHETITPLFQDQNSFLKPASVKFSRNSEVSLSFVVGSYNPTAYLTIHVENKGYYKLKISKVYSTSSIETIMIATFISYVIFYMISILSKMFRLSKNREFQEFYAPAVFGESQVPAVGNNEGPDLEMNLGYPETQVMVDDSNNGENYHTNITSLLKKLEIQNEIERGKKFEEGDQVQSNQDERETHPNNTKALSEDSCDICYVGRKTVKFEPCNHTCTCSFCALMIIQISPKCPLCREKIVEVQMIERAENDVSIKEKCDEKLNYA